MIDALLLPFQYNFMLKAIWMSALVGGACAFLSAYLILKGWSLIGDALSHSVVPGVAGAYALGLPLTVGAFFTGMLAALAIALVRQYTRLKEDAIIGFVFSTFFAVGLLIVSLNPISIDVQSIIFGNILGIDDSDIVQFSIIITVSMLILFLLRKDLLAIFFDETHTFSIGIPTLRLKIIFFAILSACIVAALQIVGAILVIAMVITPGATAYLLVDRFSKLLWIAIIMGIFTGVAGAWMSFYLDVSTGGIIVGLQTIIFLFVFLFSPKYGLVFSRIKIWQQKRIMR